MSSITPAVRVVNSLQKTISLLPSEKQATYPTVAIRGRYRGSMDDGQDVDDSTLVLTEVLEDGAGGLVHPLFASGWSWDRP